MSAALVTSLRNGVAFVISQDPITISWTRVERIPDEGAFREETTTVGPFVGRIYEASGNRLETAPGTRFGLTERDSIFRLLLPHTATLPQDDPNNKIEFTAAPYGRFRLMSVTPLVEYQQLIAIKCDLLKLA